MAAPALPPYPLYNRAYNLYRLSPLHHGPTPLLSERALRTHTKRLRDQLKGDNVRGVEVDYARPQDAIATLGPLEDCEWELLGDDYAWIEKQRFIVDPEASHATEAPSADQTRGVQVTLHYERSTYTALLLRDPETTASPEDFTSLPLLMIKMPAPIREIFLTYLRTTFDAHVAPLKLPPQFLTSTLETYFRHITAPTSKQSIRELIGQLNIQLSFPTITNLLKQIDIKIMADDVPGFVTRGKQLVHGIGKDAPFTAALAVYLKHHLALDLSHPKVLISKIDCSAFLLHNERIRIEAPVISEDTTIDPDSSDPDASAHELAVEDLYAALVKEAGGTGKFLSEVNVQAATPSSVGSARRGRRKRGVSLTAATGAIAGPKKAKGRGKENGTRRGAQEVESDVSMADA
ncbi:hypothetical protein P154DRAFT_74415 [Amniculicola lignicola CBS 123094]|uniref:Kinetochore complex Sim4 subunit Fta1-domain-containing protein n=1 Tax=Amniculicola lignicola CBS 123094 TaxID=1392246 RepID=A0A6A5VV59_9PLEO|nr:hypothetical protein P154DRAFT_74415 [Amniculicola lignicola CBS 123094]